LLTASDFIDRFVDSWWIAACLRSRTFEQSSAE